MWSYLTTRSRPPKAHREARSSHPMWPSGPTASHKWPTTATPKWPTRFATMCPTMVTLKWTTWVTDYGPRRLQWPPKLPAQALYSRFHLLPKVCFSGHVMSINVFGPNNFWSKIALMQNYFIANSLDENKLLGFFFFGRKYFGCKIISSETVWMKKIIEKIFFGQTFFSKINLVANSFPRKQFGWKK